MRVEELRHFDAFAYFIIGGRAELHAANIHLNFVYSVVAIMGASQHHPVWNQGSAPMKEGFIKFSRDEPDCTVGVYLRGRNSFSIILNTMEDMFFFSCIGRDGSAA